MNSPIWWYGGKGFLKTKIIPLLPSHVVYVEVFGGGASVLFAKEPAKIEVYNDIHSDLYNFFRVISNRETFQLFYDAVCLLPYSRELYKSCLDSLRSGVEDDDVKRAAAFFVCARQGFGGRFDGGWSVSKVVDTVGAWLNSIKKLPEIHRRLQSVVIENSDWSRIVDVYDSEGTLFYFDPPYVLSERVGGKRYNYEMCDNEHVKLVERIQRIKGQFVISGYGNKIYEVLNEYEKHEFIVPCHVEHREVKTKRKEIVWIKRQEENKLF